MKWDALIHAYLSHLPKCKDEEKRQEQIAEIERLRQLQREEQKAA